MDRLKKLKLHKQRKIIIIVITVCATAVIAGILTIAALLFLSHTAVTPNSPTTIQAPHARPTPQLAEAKVTQPTEQAQAQFVPDYSLPPAVNGLAPVVTRLQTKQKIVFLGIDDGAYKDQSVVDLLEQNHIKASLFLSRAFIANNPDFFKKITAQGSVIEDHTLSHHTDMTKTQSYAQQKSEICGMADYEEQHYGHRPTLFRPPGGAYSDTMRKAAYDCGMKAIVTWIAKANGGSMQYQIGNGLRAGDIVLMHFRPEFKKDLQAFVDAATAAGLHTELIESAPGVM